MSTALASHVFDKGIIVVITPVVLHGLYNLTAAYIWITFLILLSLGIYLGYTNHSLKDKPIIAEEVNIDEVGNSE